MDLDPIAIWLDDMRDPASSMHRDRIDSEHEVVWVKNRDEFEAAVLEHQASGRLVAIHFDNDLGVHNEPGRGQEGRHCLTWFEQQVHEQGWGPVSLFAQTANPAARRELYGGFTALRRHWSTRCGA